MNYIVNETNGNKTIVKNQKVLVERGCLFFLDQKDSSVSRANHIFASGAWLKVTRFE